jgi:hypothetical protein
VESIKSATCSSVLSADSQQMTWRKVPRIIRFAWLLGDRKDNKAKEIREEKELES